MSKQEQQWAQEQHDAVLFHVAEIAEQQDPGLLAEFVSAYTIQSQGGPKISPRILKRLGVICEAFLKQWDKPV